jgi:hypothetical protein
MLLFIKHPLAKPEQAWVESLCDPADSDQQFSSRQGRQVIFELLPISWKPVRSHSS